MRQSDSDEQYENKKQINHEEVLLRAEELTPYPQIHELIQSKAPFDQLWRTIVSFTTNQEKWLNGPMVKLNSEEIEDQVI
eukprot:Seg2143.2 transcript_id=Seg2143.2/GoldUCD/mRNA.D3Y31 product="hypothetical protein" pseudo=true protein_id=Seg2143.2/GoldUCD/D3Y31